MVVRAWVSYVEFAVVYFVSFFGKQYQYQPQYQNTYKIYTGIQLTREGEEKPTIITELGYTSAQAQLLSVPPYAAAFILTLAVAILSERTRLRAPFIISSSLLACIGYIILLSTPTSTSNSHYSHGKPGVSYLGTIFAAAGIYPAVAITLSWPANNVSGQTKRCIANALQISIGNLGAVLGTQLYRTETSPGFRLGHAFALGYLVANVFVVGITWGILRGENRRKEAVREREELGVWGVDNNVDIDGDGGEFLGDRDPRWVFQT